MRAEVYYWGKGYFKALLGYTPTREEFEQKYRKVIEFGEESMEIIWGLYLGIIPIRRLEDIFITLNMDSCVQRLIQTSGAGHTSMSVGDIVKLGDRFFICRDIGWEEIFQ
jgi:hypothetical protein